MKTIKLDKQNLSTEHLCCALSGGKNEKGVARKKDWLRQRMEEGLVFRKLDAKAKVFVEYLPAEYAWKPISAPNYLAIHCLWVSGRYKGKGYGKKLLNFCIEDAKKQGKNGVCIISGKQPFLTDTAFFLKHGFQLCDTAQPYFQLLALRFRSSMPLPQFLPNAKLPKIKPQADLEVFFTDQCPFTEHYSQEMATVASNLGLSTRLERITNCKKAQQTFSAFGTFGIFLKGHFLTHKMMSATQFKKLLQKSLV